MTYNQSKITLSIRDNDLCKRLPDPINKNTYHMEAYLPFSEAAKLERGNANVRPFSEVKKPFKEMLQTVESYPETFHLKNRGITYLCEAFEFNNHDRTLTVAIPKILKEAYDDDDAPTFGIADGGHTFEVVHRTTAKREEFQKKEGWVEPFVRVHFMSGESSQEAVDEIVEALNTSTGVQQYSLDEYQGKFDKLKDALKAAGFDLSLIAFRENENKPWHIVEIIQRLACFLKDRWQDTHPTSMYRSKAKALDLYINDSQEDFHKLFGVIYDVMTLPEYIQSQLSLGGVLEGKKLGKMKGVKGRKVAQTREGTSFPTKHELDLAALLPMAAAFRELLVLRGDRYQWRVSPKDIFPRCAEQLYKVLLNRGGKAKIISHLGTDTEYWGACAQIVMRAQTAIIEEKIGITP